MLPRGSLLTGYRRFNYFCFSSYVLWSGEGNVDFPDQAEGLVAAGLDLWWMRRIERRYRVLRILKIRHQVVRCAARESLDVGILHDRRVELNDHGINQRQDPAVVLSRILTRRRLLHARRHRAVEDHVVFLEWIHGEGVQGTDGSQVLLRAKPGVLSRPRVFPRNVDVVVLGIAADVVARGLEILAVNVNPRIPGRVLRLAEDVGTVVNAVEVDRLAVVAFPFAVRWRLQAYHRGQRRPAVDVRHHLVVLRARRNVIRPPHNARNAPAGLERRAFRSTERVGAGVRVSVLPGTVVGSRDDDGVGRLRANDIHDPADVVIEF